MTSTATPASLMTSVKDCSFDTAARVLKSGLKLQRLQYLRHLKEIERERDRAEGAIKRLKQNNMSLAKMLEASQLKNANLEKENQDLRDGAFGSMVVPNGSSSKCASSFSVLSDSSIENPFVAAKEAACRRKNGGAKANVVYAANEMTRLYKESMLTLENMYLYNEFAQAKMNMCEFAAAPIVLLIGQYSVGKTTFLRHLVGRDFPSMHIGPEPTTDTFTVVSDGPVMREIPGAVLSTMTDRPFANASRFGNSFLTHFRGVDVPNSAVLKKITLIDTPGILAGNKQRNRGYNFSRAIEWFASISDRILVIFDAQKVDISNEFQMALNSIRSYSDKTHIVLNKADTVRSDELFRCYGSMMWSLGKAVEAPEALRVYVSSLHGKPLICEDANKAFLASEMRALMSDFALLPRDSAVRRVGNLARRAKAVRAHVLLVGCLKEKMPLVFGKEKARADLIRNLPAIFRQVSQQHGIAPSDMPDLGRFRRWIEGHADWRKEFRKPRPAMLEKMTSDLDRTLPVLMKRLGASG